MRKRATAMGTGTATAATTRVRTSRARRPWRGAKREPDSRSRRRSAANLPCGRPEPSRPRKRLRGRRGRLAGGGARRGRGGLPRYRAHRPRAASARWPRRGAAALRTLRRLQDRVGPGAVPRDGARGGTARRARLPAQGDLVGRSRPCAARRRARGGAPLARPRVVDDRGPARAGRAHARPRARGRALHAGAGGPRLRCAGRAQQADRGDARDLRVHGQAPRPEHPSEARGPVAACGRVVLLDSLRSRGGTWCRHADRMSSTQLRLAYKARPLVAVVCLVPLLGGAMESALDFAEIRSFSASDGDIAGLLRWMRPDALIVDNEGDAEEAAAFARDHELPVLHVSVHERALRLYRHGGWEVIGSGEGTAPTRIRNVIEIGRATV